MKAFANKTTLSSCANCAFVQRRPSLEIEAFENEPPESPMDSQVVVANGKGFCDIPGIIQFISDLEYCRQQRLDGFVHDGVRVEIEFVEDERGFCPTVRSKAFRDITTDDVLGVLVPIWTTIPRAARETRGRIERVFGAARAKGLHTCENPARWKGHLKELLPRLKRLKHHHPAAPYAEIPGIVQKLREKHATADTDVNLAAEFVILTAVRTSEARFMRVREVNFGGRLWTIPRERMKTPKDHEVPLCDRALAILRAVVSKDAEPTGFVFRGLNSGKPLGMNAVLAALKAVYPGITTHGCRSSFRDWAGDRTSFPREVAEMALAHAIGDEVELAYRRGTALEKRRKLMEAWGAYVDRATNVVSFARAG